MDDDARTASTHRAVRLDMLDLEACSRADARLLISAASPPAVVFDLRDVAFERDPLPFLDELQNRARLHGVLLRFVHASRDVQRQLRTAGLTRRPCHRSPRR